MCYTFLTLHRPWARKSWAKGMLGNIPFPTSKVLEWEIHLIPLCLLSVVNVAHRGHRNIRQEPLTNNSLTEASLPSWPLNRPQVLGFNSSSMRNRTKLTPSPHYFHHDLVDRLWCSGLIPAYTFPRDWTGFFYPKKKSPWSKRQFLIIFQDVGWCDSLIPPSRDKFKSLQCKPKSALIKLNGLNIWTFPEYFV